MTESKEVLLEEKKRIDFLDIAKGIGIVWVLLGHSLDLRIPYYGTIAFSFHMPLFFILSGYCFTRKKDEKTLFVTLFKRYLVPYFFTIGLFIAYYLVKGNYAECKNWIWGGVYGSGWDYASPRYIKGVGGIWFFLALFWGKIIMNSIFKLPEYLCIALVSLLAYWGVYSYSVFVFPWGIQNGCIGVLFLYIGFLAKRYDLFGKTHLWWFLFSLIVWGMAIKKGYSYFTLVNCKLDLIQVITSCCGCYIVIIISKYFDFSRILKTVFIWIGKRTAIILSFHIWELHTHVCDDIALHIFSTTNGRIIFLVRLVWCFLFAFIIPKIPYVKKIYSV